MFRPHSWGSVFAELVSFMGLVFTTLIQRRFRVIPPRSWGLFSQVGVRPVKSTAIPWKPQWKPALYGSRKVSAFGGNHLWQLAWQPHVWQPPELVTIGGNRAGNHRSGSRQPRVRGCEPKVRTSLRTCCRYALRNAYQWCVPVCVPVPCVPIRWSVSRTPGCVKCVRETLRENMPIGT